MPLCFALISLALAVTISAAEAPREKFLAAFKPFNGGPVRISPDGRHLAYALREKDETAVYIAAVDGTQVAFRTVVGKEDRKRLVGATTHSDPLRVTALQWASNETVVASTSYNHFIALNHQRKAGRYLVNLNGEERILGSEHGFLAGQVAVSGRRTGRIVAVRSEAPGFAIIEATASSGVGLLSHVLLKIDVATGASESLFDDEVRGRLIYDSKGNVRGRYASGYTSTPVFLFKPDSGKGTWQPLDQLHPLAATTVTARSPETYFGPRAMPLAIERDVLYYTSNLGRNTLGIYALDLTTGKRSPFAWEDPGADLTNPRIAPGNDAVIVDRVSHDVVGLRVQDMTSSRRWLDPEIVTVQEAVKKRTRGYTVEIADWDDARERFVVQMFNRGDPGAFYLYTRSTGRLELLLPVRTPNRALDKVQSTIWSQPRRDGGSLSGWLTLPDRKGGRALPIVVRLNPSPWPRPFNSYQREVMAIAQMGFAVLDVYPRGSDGFGLAHLQAGRHDFDAVTAEDIIAALESLPSGAGIDAGRVALFGEDYGGYLALRALQLHPGRFTCAVTIEPRVELAGLLQLRYPDSEYDKFEHALRKWYFGTDISRWRDKSPATHPGLVRAPVLLTASPNSFRQNWGALNSFRRKLDAAGNPPTWVEVTGGAFVPGAEQALLWSKIEDFLTKHLTPW